MGNEVITPQRHQKIRSTYKELARRSVWKIKSDAVVIGSGAGGAVAAAELSKQGWQVVLLEEGSYFTPADFNNDEFLSYARLYRDAGNITVENYGLNILQGRTLGGSTTVNWQTCLYPSDHITRQWASDFGLKGYEQKNMQPFITELRKRIGVHLVPQQLINANNQVLWQGAKKLKLKPEVLENSSRNCIGLGRCGLGCPINAKQSMFLTYIPDALKNGALVITNMQVREIKDGKKKRVYADFSPDPYQKYPHNLNIFESIEVEAPVVILSAGAIEGPALLQRSGLGNEWVGTNLKLHPTAAIGALFKKEIHMYSGPPQSVVFKNKNKKGSHDFWLETAPARPPSLASSSPLYASESFRILKDYIHMHAGIALVRDGSNGKTQGRVQWEWGKRKVHYELSPEDGRTLLQALQSLAQIQAAAGATELIFPFTEMNNKAYPLSPKSNFNWVLKKSFAPGRIRLFSAHPHGSIPAARSPQEGALSPDFELYGHHKIFVMDASWYPTGLSVNPQITTMASALQAARKLGLKKSILLS